MFAAPAAIAAAPAPVTDLQLSTQDGVVFVDWTASPATQSAVVCYALTTAPTAPTDSGVTCSPVLNQPAWSFGGVDGTKYGISVFSYDPASQEYGTPASGTITALDPPPLPPLNLRSAGGWDSHAVDLAWAANPANHDIKDYLLEWGLGVSPSSWTSYQYTIGGTGAYVSPLIAGAVYTFRVRARDIAGNLSDYAVLRASTRQPGIALADNNRIGHAIKATTAFLYAMRGDVSALVQSDGIMRAVVATSNSVVMRTHSPTNDWNEPGSGLWYAAGARHALIAAAPRIIAVAWTANSGIYYSTKTTATWAKPIRLSSNTAETAVGFAVDKSRRLHVLVLRTAGTGQGLYYLTRYAGHTTRSFVAGSGPTDIGLLTRDPSNDKIVVVDRHRTTKLETVRVKVLAPTATSVGTMTTWLSTTTRAVQWKPTSVAANGGRISLGVQRVTSPGSTTADGPYVMYGTATMHRGAVRVAGTSAVDTNLTLSAPTATRLVLSWQRHNAGWSPSKLGIWASTRTFKTAGGYWVFGAARHWTSSAYDVPAGAFNDAAGHTYVVYGVSSTDVVQ